MSEFSPLDRYTIVDSLKGIRFRLSVIIILLIIIILYLSDVVSKVK